MLACHTRNYYKRLVSSLGIIISMGTYYLDNRMNKYLGGSVPFQFKIHENKYQLL